MREKSKEENVKYDYGEIEINNVELENSVAKLSLENEHLCNEINHVKQVFKEQFDSIKKTRVRTKEQSDSLIDKLDLKYAKNEDLKAQIQDKVFVITSLKNDLRKLKGKEIVNIAAQTPSAHTIIPGMFKLDIEPLAPRLLENKEIHIEYLKYTQEQADSLRGIELLVYVQDTCPNAIKLSAKKVAVTPKNNIKKVMFAEPLTSSSNIKHVESSTTSDSNTPVLSPTGLKCSTSNCGSKPTSNKKNDRILQKPSRNMKNKVEDQTRKVNKKNSVVEPILDNGTEFVNQTLLEFYENVGISHQTSVARTPQQNGVVKRRNQNLIEAARTISGPALHSITPITSSSGLVPNTGCQQPFQEVVAPRAVDLADSPVSTSIDQDAPSSSTPLTQEQEQSLNISQGFKESPKTPIFHDGPLNESPHAESPSQGSSSNVRQTHAPFKHLGKWTKDHPIANVIGDPSCSVSTRKQLQTDAMWCFFDAFLTSVEPKSFKQAMTEPLWIDAMQEKIHEFKRQQI
ncbi:integrase, catalytic region, zinc finger, CCHC-type containing protein [Tanacetum coccineum]